MSDITSMTNAHSGWDGTFMPSIRDLMSMNIFTAETTGSISTCIDSGDFKITVPLYFASSPKPTSRCFFNMRPKSRIHQFIGQHKRTCTRDQKNNQEAS